jgi:endonuclease YncB( thermonuclease family)
MLKRVIIFFMIIILLGLLSIYYPKLTGEEDWKGKQYEKEKCFVNRVIDGDTLVCDNETIRLLGINNIEV